jgi:nitroreductase
MMQKNTDTMADSFRALVRARRSIRSFLPDAVPHATILSVLDDARHAPSNSNIQPWLAHIVSGGSRDRLSAAMLAADDAAAHSPDFPWGYEALTGRYLQRQKAQGASYYQAVGVARDAMDDRRELTRRNLSFFGAPHACLLFMPSFYDHVRIAGDVGMFAQTFLLSLAAHGLAGVPQTYLGFYADQARQVLDIDPRYKLLFGISFGVPDLTSAAGSFTMDRAPLDELVTFHP